MRTSEPAFSEASSQHRARVTTCAAKPWRVAADAQATAFQRFGHFHDLAVLGRAKIADHGVGLVDSDAGAGLKRFRLDVRVDIGIKVVVAQRDIRCAVLVAAKINGHFVGGLSQLGVSLVVLGDQLLRFGELLLVHFQLVTQQHVIVVIGVIRAGAANHLVDNRDSPYLRLVPKRDIALSPAAFIAAPRAAVLAGVVTAVIIVVARTVSCHENVSPLLTDSKAMDKMV